jgi:hypothetical protein
MKRPIVLFAAAPLALGVAACGETGRLTGAVSTRASGAPSAMAMPARANLEAGYDLDDGPVRSYGHAASGPDARRIAALVTRYYAAGARGDGATACALTSTTFGATIPADYGQELGSAIPPGAEAYLRGAKTCAAVLSLLFAHVHRQLAARIEVTAVRLQGDYGYALVGSTTLPASLIEVGREGGAWKIEELLGRPLP